MMPLVDGEKRDDFLEYRPPAVVCWSGGGRTKDRPLLKVFRLLDRRLVMGRTVREDNPEAAATEDSSKF